MLQLNGQQLTLQQIVDVAQGREQVALAAEARARVEQARQVVQDIVAQGRTVYGVNTGFGKLSDVSIDRAAVGFVPGWIVFVFGIVFNAAIAVFAIGTVRLREATGEVLPKHEFSLRPLKRMTSWTAATTRRTTVRAKRARQRVRSRDTTAEFKKIDISETPDKTASVR